MDWVDQFGHPAGQSWRKSSPGASLSDKGVRQDAAGLPDVGRAVSAKTNSRRAHSPTLLENPT